MITKFTGYLMFSICCTFVLAFVVACGGSDGGTNPRLEKTQQVQSLHPETLRENGYYFSIRTERCPNGELRGQIVFPAVPVDDEIPATVNREVPAITIATTLTNDQQVPGCPNATGIGMATGRLQVNAVNGDVLDASIDAASGLSSAIIAAGLHEAPPKKTGPLVLPLALGS